jgi:hypothetical protein
LANAALDHILSLTIFMVAIVIFIGMFTQNMQTGMAYQRHNAMATKTSDLLDTMLLSDGLPNGWGERDDNVAAFGLLDNEAYSTSSYSPTRLACSDQSPVYYSTNGVQYYNLTAGFGGYLLTPTTKTLSYSNASRLLGVNGTYGFHLSLSPTVTVSIQKTSSTGTPLRFLATVAGTGYPLANAPIVCNLLLVNEDEEYPFYTAKVNSSVITDLAGMAEVTFPEIDGEKPAYALVVYSYLDGLKGVGYYVNTPESFSRSVVPLIESYQNRMVQLVHSDALREEPQAYSELTYNASFFIRTEEFTFRSVSLTQPTGSLVYGSVTEPDHSSIEVPDNEGVLIVTYKGEQAEDYGIVLIPWGFGALGFSLNFGGDSRGHEWVTTDIRQVTIGGIAYQAKLELWALNGGA